MKPPQPQNQKSFNVIAIDGPAGAGKSTVAKRLSKMLGFSYLDTGAMYRALTLKTLREKVNWEDEDALVALANKTKIDIEGDAESLKVLLDGEDVTKEIRSMEVTNNTFYIARIARVREIMVKCQRSIAEKRSLVAEGRDIGTVVFPNAKRKFYLDADLKERSRRRLLELKQQGKSVDAQRLTKDMQDRDARDISRLSGPLKMAEDAIFIESTQMTVDQTVEKMLSYIKGSGNV